MAGRKGLPAHVAASVAEALRRKPAPAPWKGVAKAAKRTGPRGMNKLEAAWAEVLRERELRGEVLWWRWEGITLKLGADVRYTPDFAVVVASGEMEMHETKGGFFRDDAKAKLRIAADLYPFRFVLVRLDEGVWKTEEVATR